ncbi:MAG: hypothetical protein EBU76_05820 [Gammaproteobacteria bacterium]|nr:hypothetical protein [Gammaproteobacteria bacterium]
MLRNPFGIALVVYYLFMAIVGMLVPDDILKSYAWAREFSDFMAGIVPQIDQVTALNIKPDVNRFYFSVLWAGSPVLLVIVCLMLLDGKQRRFATMWTTPFAKMIWPMFFGLITVVAFLKVNWLADPQIRLSIFSFGTPLGRALLAQVFVLGPIFFGPGVLIWIAGWITGYIPRNIERSRNV